MREVRPCGSKVASCQSSEKPLRKPASQPDTTAQHVTLSREGDRWHGSVGATHPVLVGICGCAGDGRHDWSQHATSAS